MSQAAPPIAHHRLRRWIFRIAIAAAALFLVIVITAQTVFSTDLPRNLVVNALQKQLGLRIEVSSLSTGWLGYTTLHGVTLALPLADHAFLDVPTLELRHSSIIRIILTRSVSIQAISLNGARLDVTQDAGGNWNLQKVAQLLARVGGAKNASADAGGTQNGGIPQLPRLAVNNATVVVTDNRRRSATIANLSLTGAPDGALVWQYQAVVPNQLNLVGKVAPGGVWAHQITLNLHDVASWMSPWIRSWPASAHLNARWSGEIDNGGLSGRLDLDHTVFASTTITGAAEISAQNGQAVVQPARLALANATSQALSARLDDGQIVFNATDVECRQLSVAFDGGRASLDGKFSLADGTASLQTHWRDVLLPQSVRQSGDLSVNYTPSLGRPRFKATLDTHGTLQSGTWDGQIDLDAVGSSLRSLSITLTAQQLRFQTSRHQSIDLSGLVAEVGAIPGGFVLQDLRLGDSNPMSGQGGYTMASQTAWFCLDARGWPIPHAAPATLDLDLNCWTDPWRIHLQQLYLRCGLLSASADGECVYNQPKPVSAHLYVTESRSLAGTEDEPQSFQGLLHGHIDLDGTISPPNLTVSGAASGADLQFRQRRLGDLKLALTGNIRDGQVSLASRNIKLFGGNWRVAGRWPVKNSLLHLDTVSVEHLSLPLALARNDVAGSLDGNWSLDIRQPTLSGMALQGSATVSGLAIGNSHPDSAAPLLAADQIQFPSMWVQDGYVEIKPIILLRRLAGATGRASGELSTTLADPTNLWMKLDAASWPVPAGGALSLLWAKANLDMDVEKRSALGHVDLRADTSWRSHAIARVDTAVEVDRRRIDATKIEIHALNGSALGSAGIDLDHPYQAMASLHWSDIDLSRLQALSPAMSTLSGKIEGNLRVQPASVPRPLEPLAITLHVHPEDMQMEGVKIGDAQTFAYLGPSRLVLDDDPERPSQLAIADGIVQLWGRISRHPGDVYQSLVQVNLQNLDLDAIIPSGAKVARTPGRLGGRITIVGRPGAPDLAFGEGRLTLSQSDLAGSGPIALLYRLMHLGHNANKPQGYGTIDFALQHQTAIITAMRYFDRGAEVHAAGVIGDLMHIPHSPINLIAVGSARPLKSLDLPGLADIDDVLSAIQHDAITIHVGGYLNKPRSVPVLFSGIGQDMQNLLIGNAGSDQSGE